MLVIFVGGASQCQPRRRVLRPGEMMREQNETQLSIHVFMEQVLAITRLMVVVAAIHELSTKPLVYRERRR